MPTREYATPRRKKITRVWTPAKLAPAAAAERELRIMAQHIARYVTPKTVLGGPKGDCLVWQGGTSGGCDASRRRPTLKYDGRIIYVSRLVLAVKLGRRLRKGKVAAHSCDYPLCVNEAHLSEQSQSKNVADGWSRCRRKPSTLVEQ